MRPRIIVISDEQVFPTRSGGQLLISNELAALKKFADVQVLVCTREDLQSLPDQGTPLVFARRSFIQSLAIRPWQSYQFSSRDVWAALRDRASEVEAFDIVLCHHEWTVPLALKLRNKLNPNAKVVLRSHNDEYQFFSSLRSSSLGRKRVYYSLEMLRMSRKRLLAHASKADQVWALTRENAASAFPNLHSVVVLPPALLLGTPEHRREVPRSFEIAFLGSLDMPHAVEGLAWFIREVLPLVVRSSPSCLLKVGGRRPSGDLLALIERSENVEYVGEVESAAEFVSHSRVYINPVFKGSGVNMKMGLPVQLGVPVVTTEIGIRGLDGIKDVVFWSNSAFEQAQEIINLIRSDCHWLRASASIACFGDRYTIEHVALRMQEQIDTLELGSGSQGGPR